MYFVTFDLVEDLRTLIDKAVYSEGFVYAFVKDDSEAFPEEFWSVQLFFSTEHNAVLFELKNR